MPDGLPESGATAPLVDQFGRQVTYLRLSVTDRCDLRCTYCMAERMQFLPKPELLTIEELDQVAAAFLGAACRRSVSRGANHLFDAAWMS